MTVCSNGHPLCEDCFKIHFPINPACPLCRFPMLVNPPVNRPLMDLILENTLRLQSVDEIPFISFSLQEQPFAQGSTSDLYLGKHKSGSKVVVKKLRSMNLEKEKLSDIKTTVKSISQLSHPNICRLFGMTTFPDSSLGIVMEWIDGGVLSKKCKEFSFIDLCRISLGIVSYVIFLFNI